MAGKGRQAARATKGKSAKGDGFVTQETDGTWRAIVYIDKKPVRRRAKTKEAAEALLEELRVLKAASAQAEQPVEELLDELNALKRAGVNVRAGTQTLAEWLDVWLEAKTRALGPRARKNYQYMVDAYLVPLLGEHSVNALTADIIQRALNKAQDDIIAAHTDPETGDVRFTGTRTIKILAQILRGAFTLAIQRRLIPFSPMEGVELPKYQRTVPPTLTDAQLLAFLAAADAHPLAPLWWLYGLLGLRRGEGIGLRWGDLDLEHGTVHVQQQFQELGGKLTAAPPKNSCVRILPLPDLIVERLRRHRTAQRAQQLRRRTTWNDQDLVFVTRDGNPWWPSNLTEEFRLLARAANLPENATLHGLRHTVANLLAECDVNEAAIAPFLGHQKRSVTLRYTNVRVEAMRQVYARVLRRLFPPTSDTAAHPSPAS